MPLEIKCHVCSSVFQMLAVHRIWPIIRALLRIWWARSLLVPLWQRFTVRFLSTGMLRMLRYHRFDWNATGEKTHTEHTLHHIHYIATFSEWRLGCLGPLDGMPLSGSFACRTETNAHLYESVASERWRFVQWIRRTEDHRLSAVLR